MKLKAFLITLMSAFTIFSFSLLSSSATDSDYSGVNLRIISKNLAYKDSVHLLVACDNDGVDSSKIELIFWNYKPSAVTDTPTHVDTESAEFYNSNGGVLFDSVFESFGISAKDMSDEIYMASHIKGTDIYSRIYRYSALEYLYERLAIGNPTEVQHAFYESVISYAENAQLVLNHEVDELPSDLCYVYVKGGKMSDGYKAGLYAPGSKITFSADFSDAFSMWTDKDGNILSSESSFTAEITEGNNIFFAVEGYSITVTVGDEVTTRTYEKGDVAQLSAPSYITSDSGREYFIGWKNSEGTLISTSATVSVTVNATESYVAEYAPIPEIEGSTLLDYSTSTLPIISDTAHSDSSVSCDIISLKLRNKIDGNSLYIETARQGMSGDYYLNTLFEGADSATSAHFTFDMLFYQRDINEVEGIDRGDYTLSPDNDTLYTLNFKSGNAELSISVRLHFEDGALTGFALAFGDDEALGIIGFDEVGSISVEISESGDKASASVFLNGKLITSSLLDTAYEPVGTQSLSVCIGGGTQGRIYIDNLSYYSLH